MFSRKSSFSPGETTRRARGFWGKTLRRMLSIFRKVASSTSTAESKVMYTLPWARTYTTRGEDSCPRRWGSAA